MRTDSRSTLRPTRRRRIRVGVIGAGAFARSMLMPPLSRIADIAAIATATGVSARSSATRFGADIATTDASEVLLSPDVDAVLIATRHDSHAEYVVAALQAGKHVFVEKPLALTEEQLQVVESAAANSNGILMVGFNRRFAPLGVQLKGALAGRGPLLITYRVNAGRLPRHHWTRDPAVGGGRIIGEACHFVDFASYLAGGPPTTVATTAVAGGSEPLEENLTATLTFPDGSLAQVTYTAYGDASLAKERVEVFGEAGAGVLDDYQELRLHQHGSETLTSGKRDKGHSAEIHAFIDGCRSGRQPWPVADMAAVMRATFDVRELMHRPAPSPSS